MERFYVVKIISHSPVCQSITTANVYDFKYNSQRNMTTGPLSTESLVHQCLRAAATGSEMSVSLFINCVRLCGISSMCLVEWFANEKHCCESGFTELPD